MSLPSRKAAAPVDGAELFAALGDGTRLALVEQLSQGGPASITRLSAGSALTRQAITKHLHVLAAAGLAHDRPRGRERIWELDGERLKVAQRRLDQIGRAWDERLARLKALVESE